jgi:hypothetical protein
MHNIAQYITYIYNNCTFFTRNIYTNMISSFVFDNFDEPATIQSIFQNIIICIENEFYKK